MTSDSSIYTSKQHLTSRLDLRLLILLELNTRLAGQLLIQSGGNNATDRVCEIQVNPSRQLAGSNGGDDNPVNGAHAATTGDVTFILDHMHSFWIQASI
jgi:hypothetical protein